ncbi:MAG: STAS domain-containing protein [Crocinitomicaceae bacterium]|nr:STAS domain-containing protein [Crocinitomicaceae bacterium]
MNFEKVEKDKYTLITTNAEKLDSTNAPELKAELVVINKNGVNNIVIDLSKTKYCDSSGLSAVLVANRLCKNSGGMFILCGLQASVSKLISISQLDKVLTIVPTAEEAEKHLSMSEIEKGLDEE